MSELITDSGSYEPPTNPRYVDPPVVHLEQVIYCVKHYPAPVEAMYIEDGMSLCGECIQNK